MHNFIQLYSEPTVTQITYSEFNIHIIIRRPQFNLCKITLVINYWSKQYLTKAIDSLNIKYQPDILSDTNNMRLSGERVKRGRIRPDIVYFQDIQYIP